MIDQPSRYSTESQEPVVSPPEPIPFEAQGPEVVKTSLLLLALVATIVSLYFSGLDHWVEAFYWMAWVLILLVAPQLL